MRASVIIVAYNGMQHLSVCLPSVLSELTSSDELILLDNHSSDDTVRYVRENFPTISLLEADENLGFAAGCNLGAKQARGEYLVFLNQDTQVYPGWLSGLLEPLTDSRVGLTTSLAVTFDDPNVILSCGNNIHFTGLNFALGFGKPVENSRPEQIPAVSGASFAIPKKLWQQLDGFDENFFMYYEETDLCWRAQSLGYACWLAPQSRLAHHHSHVKSARVIYYTERNRRLTVFKNYHWLTLLLIAPSLLLSELLQCIHLILLGKFAASAKLKADLWLMRNWRVVARARRFLPHSLCKDYRILSQRSYKIEIMERDRKYRVFEFMMPLVNFCYHVNYILTRFVLSLFK